MLMILIAPMFHRSDLEISPVIPFATDSPLNVRVANII